MRSAAELLLLVYSSERTISTVPTSEIQEPSSLAKVPSPLFRQKEELVNILTLKRPQTRPPRLKIKNPKTRRQSLTIQRRQRESPRPYASLAPKTKYIPLHIDIQGLAMSRSIGDNVSKTVGVSCQPEIIQYKLE